MKLHEINIGDVVVLNDHSIMIVAGIETSRPKNPIVIQKNLHKQYICPPEHVQNVIGKVNLDKLQICSNHQIEADNNAYAFLLPQKLKDMKLEIGVSKIRVKHAGKVITATFAEYKPSRWKYPVTYITARGGRYKCSLDAVISKA